MLRVCVFAAAMASLSIHFHASGEPPQQTRLAATAEVGRAHRVLAEHCLDCHSADVAEGEIVLDFASADWSNSHSFALLERAFNAVDSHEMPPKDSAEISSKERAVLTRWADETLRQNTSIGGTLARRLNASEYRATIESLFGIKNFALPNGFPADREHHGFDNLGEGLVLSPPLLDAYAATASLVADELFPPPQPEVESQSETAEPKDLVISYSSGQVIDGAFRLGMKCSPIQRSCTWPSRIEARASGVFQIAVELSSFRPDPTAEPMIAKIFARDIASKDSVSHPSLRLLKEITVTSESPERFEFEATLYEGQTPVLHWANATLDSDRADKADLVAFFEDRGKSDPQYLAAWSAVTKGSGQGFRGGIGWERVKLQMESGEVADLSAKDREAFFKAVASNPVLYAETVVFDIFENGPALEIHKLEVEGPTELVEGPRERERQELRDQLLGEHASAKDAIQSFLPRAFRRPVDAATVSTYTAIFNDHLAAGHTTDEAFHLLIRNVLISPRFLYRSLTDGPLDNHDLATRLSYFLKGQPADDKLLAKVDSGSLIQPDVLRSQAERLIPTGPSAPFIKQFTEQWLDTRLLADIMPDRKFKFSASDSANAKREVEAFFAEMLRENRPMTDFIDPDFTWTTPRIAKNVYELNDGYNKKKANDVQRIQFERGGRYGGVLGQSAVLMATANGVDTQPVLRGVWVLENILGSPPPPPPAAVPPITPDTRGAKTPRELLEAHTADTACAGCHKRIDPVGLVLENFDPVGRWRDEWPDVGIPITTATTLPDGTKIQDIVEFKKWLVANVDIFSQCLAEKLMTYATGRVLNYSERRTIEAIVIENRQNGNGFRDLMLALIDSEVFRTK